MVFLNLFCTFVLNDNKLFRNGKIVRHIGWCIQFNNTYEKNISTTTLLSFNYLFLFLSQFFKFQFFFPDLVE